MIIRKIHSQDENDILKFMQIREESIIDDTNTHNLMTYLDEEKDFSVDGYKKYNFLKNFIIAEENNIFIGYIAYHERWVRNFQGNHNITIGPLYVSPNFRGQHIGKKLVEFSEKEILKNFLHPIICLHLLVNSENLPAIALYKQCGFKQVGKHPNYIQTREGQYFDAVIMQKNIIHNTKT